MNSIRIYVLSAIILLVFNFSGFAQNSNSVHGKIVDSPNTLVYLKAYYGYQSPVVDSVKTDRHGRFTFNYTPSYSEGMMRVTWGNAEDNLFLDIAVEDSISFIWKNPEIVEFKAGEKSRAFNRLLEETSILREKLELLDEVLDYFEDDKKFSKQTIKRWQNTRREISKSYADFYREVGKSPFAEFGKALQQLEPPKPQFSRNIDNFWQSAEFNHPILLHWNLIPQKVREYFNYFIDIPNTPQEAESIAKRFTDLSFVPILNNPPVRENIVSFLVEGFESMGMSSLVMYLEENYLPEEGCTDERPALEERLRRIRAFQPGKRVPPLSDKNINIGLSFPNERNIIIFFSPYCPHCVESLPTWLSYTRNAKDLHVYAISIEDENATRKALPQIPENWTLITSPKLADDYMIYSTPSYFIVSKDGTILQRPVNITDVDMP